MPWLSQCLDCCAGYPLIIVDNASTDQTVDYIKTNYPEITLLPQSENLGFGQSNNIGISLALSKGADYVFLLNQDAYLQKGCIEKVVAVQKENSDFGILSPIHLNGKGNRLDRNFSNYVGFERNADFYSDYVLKKSLQEVYEVPFVNAAGWLLSRDILETVGGFDPIFFHYGEDDNYCQRARYHDFKIGVVSSAFLNHDREDRVIPPVIRGTNQHFENMESSLKTKFGNINLENEGGIEALISKRIKSKRRAYLKLEFTSVKYLKKEIALIKRLKIPIYASVAQNKIPGKTYLDDF